VSLASDLADDVLRTDRRLIRMPPASLERATMRHFEDALDGR
jgi:hypothetical protein